MAQGTLAKLAAIICCKGDSSTSRKPAEKVWEKVLLFDCRKVDAIACTSVLVDSLENSTPMIFNAYGEIDGLVGRFNREIRRIMGDWLQIKIKELEVEKKEIDSSITTVKNEVYQLGGLYTVFIGVLFTAVSTSSKLECRHIWSPIVLCCMGFLMMAFIAHKKFKFLEDTHVTRTFPHFLQRKVISYCVNRAKDPERHAEIFTLESEFRFAELYLKFLSQQGVLDENSPARLTWPVGSLECPKGAKPVDRAPQIYCHYNFGSRHGGVGGFVRSHSVPLVEIPSQGSCEIFD